MTTNETYIARLRKLISEAPDGLDVGPLEVALASAEAALASSDSTGDRTKIWFLLDRSGSMSRLTGDVIGGFNQFVTEQAAKPGKARLTAVQFDGTDPFEVIFDAHRITQVPALTSTTYRPRGVTPRPGNRALLRGAGHADARVVLLGGVDMIRKLVVYIDAVELGRQLGGDRCPRASPVERDTGPAVVSLDHALGVPVSYTHLTLPTNREV